MLLSIPLIFANVVEVLMALSSSRTPTLWALDLTTMTFGARVHAGHRGTPCSRARTYAPTCCGTSSPTSKKGVIDSCAYHHLLPAGHGGHLLAYRAWTILHSTRYSIGEKLELGRLAAGHLAAARGHPAVATANAVLPGHLRGDEEPVGSPDRPGFSSSMKRSRSEP